MTDPFIGEIRAFGFTFAPTGWATCDGQLMPISQARRLFTVLGTTYGGDGTNNFRLPNLQGAIPLQWGQGHSLSPYNIGATGGVETVVLSMAQMPRHNHEVQGAVTPGDQTLPGGNLPATVAGDSPYGTTGEGSSFAAAVVPPVGNGMPHNNLMPYLTVTYCIALDGVPPGADGEVFYEQPAT